MMRSCFLACGMLFAMTGAVPSQDGALPFGFAKLHWGMSQQEAEVQFSSLAPPIKAPQGAPMTNQTGRFFGPYVWHNCLLEIWAYFGDGKLDRIVLESARKNEGCRADASAELGLTFGDATIDANPWLAKSGMQHFQYQKGDTTALMNVFSVGEDFELSLT